MTTLFQNRIQSATGFISGNLTKRPIPTITLFIAFAIISGLVMIRVMAIADRAVASTDGIDPSKVLTVNAVTVRAIENYNTKQKISGQVVARRESDHGFDRSGVLAEVLVDEGDRVKKGDILAKLDMRMLDARTIELKAELESAKAALDAANATLVRVSADYDRYGLLKSKGHISQARFEQVENELESAKAGKTAATSSVEKVNAALAALQADRDMSVLRARFDGSVVKRYFDEGASFGMGGGPMVRLVEDQSLEIRVGLSETAAESLKIGERYRFNQSGSEIGTTLRSVTAKVDQNTRTVTGIFDVEKDADIRPGSLAELTIDVNVDENGFWLPTEALAESRRGLWSGYSLSPVEGYSDISRLSREELQVIYTEADRVFVRGTLEDGDRVVSSGTHRLSDGFLVRAN